MTSSQAASELRYSVEASPATDADSRSASTRTSRRKRAEGDLRSVHVDLAKRLLALERDLGRPADPALEQLATEALAPPAAESDFSAVSSDSATVSGVPNVPLMVTYPSPEGSVSDEGPTASFVLDEASTAALREIVEWRKSSIPDALRLSVSLLHLLESAERQGWDAYLSDGEVHRRIVRS